MLPDLLFLHCYVRTLTSAQASYLGVFLFRLESRQFYFIKSYLIQIFFHLDFISSRFYFIQYYLILSRFYFISFMGLELKKIGVPFQCFEFNHRDWDCFCVYCVQIDLRVWVHVKWSTNYVEILVNVILGKCSRVCFQVEAILRAFELD